MKTLDPILRLMAAIMLGQSLYFKFSGAPEAVHLFQAVGIEPRGRYATAVAELITVVLLLVPRTAAIGALLGLGVMAGAIGSHLTKIGIVVLDDGGTLFGMAIVLFLIFLAVVVHRRRELPGFLVRKPVSA